MKIKRMIGFTIMLFLATGCHNSVNPSKEINLEIKSSVKKGKDELFHEENQEGSQ